MKIVVACDSFKGSLSSLEIGRAAARGVIKAYPEAEVRVAGIADGGEGTLEAFRNLPAVSMIPVEVDNPVGQKIMARYAVSGDTAIIESAQACGLTLIDPEHRNPSVASSYGVGEMIRHALQQGLRKFIIGLGGSAVNDGGAGMLQALGIRLNDKTGAEIVRGGIGLKNLRSIDYASITPGALDSEFIIASDVTNPLCGANGASRTFGPQKGATPEMVDQLDSSLRNFANITRSFTGSDQSETPGAGAAGGMGFALLSFLNGEIKSGVDVILDAIGFDEMLEDCELVITGEGRMDAQTCMGKAPYGIIRRCEARKIPVIGICGSIEPDSAEVLNKNGLLSVFPIQSGPIDLKDALGYAVTIRNIERTCGQIIRTFCHNRCGVSR